MIFMKLEQEKIDALRLLVETEPKNIVILSHTNPDGDAIGSSLAWGEALRRKGHKVTCIVPNKYPYYLDWMTGISELVILRLIPSSLQRTSIELALSFTTIGKSCMPLCAGK